MLKITYYDFSYINDAGFHALGFQRTEKELGHRFIVSKEVPPELVDLDLPSWLTLIQPSSIMIYRYESADHNFLFCIDSGDHNGADPAFPGYYLALLEKVRFYFKVNYLQEVVDNDASLADLSHKIIPIPLTFGLRPDNPWPFRPKILPGGGVRWPYEAVKRRLRLLKNQMSYHDFEQLRQIPRDIDVFFVSILYLNPELEEMNDWRLSVVEYLSKQTGMNNIIGFVSSSDDFPASYADFRLPRMDLDAYMSQLARSKIGLYVRGTFDAISYKFGHMFALGKPIVGQSIINNQEYLSQLDCFSTQFIYDDPQEMAERLVALANNPAELQHLGEVNLRTFENHLSPPAVARYMLDKIQANIT